MRVIPDATFEVNGPAVISETIDGETIIINLENGTYFCLKYAGTAIWAAIQQSVSLRGIAAFVRSSYDVDGHDIEHEIVTLVQRLVEEELIRPTLAVPSPVPCASSSEERLAPFLPPVLDKFTDMQALLLLDPVHDVDEKGWPNLRPQDSRLDD